MSNSRCARAPEAPTNTAESRPAASCTVTPLAIVWLRATLSDEVDGLVVRDGPSETKPSLVAPVTVRFPVTAMASLGMSPPETWNVRTVRLGNGPDRPMSRRVSRRRIAVTECQVAPGPTTTFACVVFVVPREVPVTWMP